MRDDEAANDIRIGETVSQVPSYETKHSACTLSSGWLGRVDVSRSSHEGDRTRKAPHQYSVAILGTCKKVHSEAALLPFTLNSFSFDHLQGLTGFVERLMFIQQAAGKSIIIHPGMAVSGIWTIRAPPPDDGIEGPHSLLREVLRRDICGHVAKIPEPYLLCWLHPGARDCVYLRQGAGG